MAHVLIMPRQGNTVESCVIVRWKAAEGQSVAAEAPVCEVETDKASFEVPAGVAGTLLKILHPEGDDVPVLQPIAVIGEKGEDWQAAVGGAAVAPAASAAPKVEAAAAAAPAPAVAAHNAPVAQAAASTAVGVSPRARGLAAREGLDAGALAGTGPGGRVIERDVRAAMAAGPGLTAAARAAVSGGAAYPASGSALGGRAGVADLGAASAAPAASQAARPVAADARREERGQEKFTETPLKSIRKLIADRMRASLASTAQLTFNGSCKAERVMALRARFKASDKALGLSEVTVGDLVLYAVSRVIPQFPNVNAHLVDGKLRVFERVHLGLAVDTPRGLMVPVIRNADLLSLQEISAESKRLAAACIAGNVNPDELSGATFTVSNLGAFGIESFTPVLNAPEVGILGVDAVTNHVVVGPDGKLAAEPRMGLSITVDHQIVDGAPAARILKAIGDAIADIDLLLMK